MRRHLLPFVPALLLAVSLTGCGEDQPGVAATGTSTAAADEFAAPLEPEQSGPPVDELPAAPSAQAPSAQAPSAQAPAEASPTQEPPAEAPPAEAPATSSDRPVFPQDVESPEQGGRYIAVVLAVGDSAALQASQASVARYRYDAAVSEVACLQGVGPGLDLQESALVTSLLFKDARTATQFADAYVAAEDGQMIGRGPARVYCVD